MKKFTLVFALIFSVMCVMGQKAVKDLNTIKPMFEKSTAVQCDITDKVDATTNTKAPGDVIYHQDFAAWPIEGWEIIATNTGNQTWYHDPSRGNPVPCMSMSHANPPLFRDEKLISNTVSIPLDNPYFLFDFSTSYYWLVGENSDDMKIYVSTDGGTTWGNHIWAEDDAALVTASLVPFPYANFTWYTARINMTAYAGEDVRIMFHFLSNVGGAQMGVSFYLDNFKIIENYTNELSVGAIGASNMNYGFYSALPKNHVGAGSGLNYFHVPVSNVGINAQTNVTLNVEISKGESIIHNWNSTPIANIPAFTNDTFKIGNRDPEVQTTPLFTFPAEMGQYKVKYTVSQTEEDQAPENNTKEFNFTVTGDYLTRHNTITSSIGANSFVKDGVYGNFIGTTFVLLEDDEIKGAEFFLSSLAVLDNSFRLQIYESTSSGWVLVEGAESEIIDIAPGMPGSWITVNFEEPISLPANGGDNFYVIGLEVFIEDPASQNLNISSDNRFHHWYNVSSRLRIGTEWFYVSYVPAIYVNFERALHNVTFVVNDPDGEPVTDAVITLGATTNEAGNYVFQVAEGTYNYTITAAGFETATGTVTVGDGDETVTVGLTVGIENNLVENLMVYPNPVRNALNVKFNVTDNMPVSVQLISADGRVVYSEKAQVNGQYNSTLDMSGNANGVYFLRIETAAGVTHQKVMKF